MFTAWTVFGLWSASQYHLVNRVNDRPMESFTRPFVILLASAWLWAAMTPVIVAMARKFPVRRPHISRALLVHLVLVVLVCAFDVVVDRLIRPFTGMHGPPGQLVASFLNQFNLNAFSYFVVVAITHAIDHATQANERLVRAARLENELHVTQLHVLRMQLQPHFLFNTLHAVSELVHEDPAAADEVVGELADLLRISIDTEGRQEIPLSEELDFLGGYLRIQQIRFRERLRVSTSVTPDAANALVPGLILQPLVENSIRHGLSSKVEGGTVEVTAERMNGSLVMRVRDSGVGFSAGKEDSGGIGLANTRERLRHLYGSASRLSIWTAPEGGAVVEIRLPFRPAGGEVRIDD